MPVTPGFGNYKLMSAQYRSLLPFSIPYTTISSHLYYFAGGLVIGTIILTLVGMTVVAIIDHFHRHRDGPLMFRLEIPPLPQSTGAA